MSGSPGQSGPEGDEDLFGDLVQSESKIADDDILNQPTQIIGDAHAKASPAKDEDVKMTAKDEKVLDALFDGGEAPIRHTEQDLFGTPMPGGDGMAMSGIVTAELDDDDDEDLFGDGAPALVEKKEEEEEHVTSCAQFSERDLFGEEDDVDSPKPQPEIADLDWDDEEEEEDEDDDEAEDGGKKAKKGKKGGKAREVKKKVKEEAKVKEEPIDLEDQDVKICDDDDEGGGSPRRVKANFMGIRVKEGLAGEEDEERDLFGELSDEEEEGKDEVEEHNVRKRLLPDGDVHLFKIPNTLSIEKEAYDPASVKPGVVFKEKKNVHDRVGVRLCGPENTVRWRFKMDEHGKKERDENNEAVLESNTQFVEWEDGTTMLQIGNEYYDVLEREENRSHLFVEEDNDLFVFHKPITKHLHAVPAGRDTATHSRLLSAQVGKIRTHRELRTLSVSQAKALTEAQDAEAEAARVRELKERSMIGGMNKKALLMDASYLECDDAKNADGPSLKQLKKRPELTGFLHRAADTLK